MLETADLVVKATVLLAAAAAVSTLMRRAPAASRHVVWTVALLSVLLLPAVSLLLPRWQLALVTVSPDEPAVGSQVALRSAPSAAAAFDLAPSPRTASPALENAVALVTGALLPSWPALLAVLWSAGVLAVAGRLVLGLAAVSLLSRRTEDAANAPWLPRARELVSHLGIAARVRFRRSTRARMPMTWGLTSATVVMPAEADAWPVDRVRVVILHELAHVKRRDCLIHVIAQVACAVYWFHPLAWLAAKRLRAEREHACDDLVLAAGTCGSDYANLLLDLARVTNGSRFPSLLAGATLAMAHPSQLEGRLMAILDTTMPRSGAGRFRTIAISVLFAIALVPLASMQPWAYEAPGAAATPQSSQPRQAAPAPDARQSSSGALAGVPGGIPGGVRGGVPGGTPGAIQGGVVGGVEQAAVIVDPTPRWNPSLHAKLVFERERKPADPKVIAALTAALKDTDADVRATVLASLVELRDPAIFQPLVQALSDAAADVRKQAAFGLGQMRDKRAFEPLLAALKDKDADVRTQAAFALGQLGDPRAIDALTAALKDPSADVRKVAAFALVELAR